MDDEPQDVQPRIKRRVTKEVVLEEIDELVTKIDEHIDKLQKTMGGQSGSRFLRGVRNRMLKIRRDAKRMKRSRTFNPDATIYRASPELAKFLKLEEPSISRLDLQRAMSAYIHLAEDETREGILKWKHLNNGRDLRSEDNRKIIEPNAQLQKLLDYNRYVEQIANGEIRVRNRDGTTRVYDDDALQYWVVMRLLKPHLTKLNTSTVVDTDE